MDFSSAGLTSLAALIISLITLVWAILHFASLTQVREDLETKDEGLRTDIEALKVLQAASLVKIDLFWSVIQTRVGSLVKAPTHERLDALVDAFSSHLATVPELKELQEQLGLRAQDVTLQPIQEDAVALVLLFVADRLAAKRAAMAAGQPEPPQTRAGASAPTETQHALEKQQVRDKERKQEDLG